MTECGYFDTLCSANTYFDVIVSLKKVLDLRIAVCKSLTCIVRARRAKILIPDKGSPRLLINHSAKDLRLMKAFKLSKLV